MKCDKCNGVGAYSYKPEPTKEERTNGSTLPTLLPAPKSSTIKACDKCKGTGEIL